MADRQVHSARNSEEALEFLTVRPDGEGWIGMAPTWFGEYVFGGCVIGQAVFAATRSAPEGRRMHSLHAYFLRPAVGGRPISYRIASIRDGRTFATRQLEASQDGAHLLSMMCSFTADIDGYEYELPIAREVPGPEEREARPGPGPWIGVNLGPTPPEADGARRSTHRIWFRIPGDLPDEGRLSEGPGGTRAPLRPRVGVLRRECLVCGTRLEPKPSKEHPQLIARFPRKTEPSNSLRFSCPGRTAGRQGTGTPGRTNVATETAGFGNVRYEPRAMGAGRFAVWAPDLPRAAVSV